MKIEAENPLAVVKAAYWLAYQASRPVGVGFLHYRTDATPGGVWGEVYTQGKKADGDYLYGRMVKLYLRWDDAAVETPDGVPHPEHQSWDAKYGTYAELLAAAAEYVESQGGR